MSTSKRNLEWRSSIPVLIVLGCIALNPAWVEGGEFSPVRTSLPVELRLPDLDGRNRDIEEFRGKVVLVNFWASWCPPCVEEMPSMQRLAEEMRGMPFAVIGINVAEAGLRVRTMTQRLGIRFPILLDRDRAVFNRWGGSVLPTTYVLDGKGMIRYLVRGPLEWDGVEAMDLLQGLMGHGHPFRRLPETAVDRSAEHASHWIIGRSVSLGRSPGG